MTIPILKLDTDREKVEAILRKLRLDPAELALSRGERAKQFAAVNEIFAAVADRGDEALVESARQFDDPSFSADQIRVAPWEMREASGRITKEQMSALRRSIAQVREYQSHIMPKDP